MLRHPASGHCLCNGRCHRRRPPPVTAASCNGRRHRRRPLSATAAYNSRPLSVTAAVIAAALFPVTAALLAAPALCNGRRLRCRSCSVTAAASAAARFLFVLSELPPLWVPVLRLALLCGPLFLSILNYGTANCPRIAAPYCA
jgi:hypothetical protein